MTPKTPTLTITRTPDPKRRAAFIALITKPVVPAQQGVQQIEEAVKVPVHRFGKVVDHALIDAADADLIVRHKWLISDAGYACRYTSNKGNTKMILMHREILQVTEGYVIDHRNRNPLDNRRENLREATRRQNNRNRMSKSKCGFRGVYKATRSERYFAQIRDIEGKNVYLGLFDSPEQAARAFDAAALKLHGDFAQLNFPA